jgi:hypothetical protein
MDVTPERLQRQEEGLSSALPALETQWNKEWKDRKGCIRAGREGRGACDNNLEEMAE